VVGDLRVFRHVGFFVWNPLAIGVFIMGGKTDVAKGRIKEAAGVLTGNNELRTQGKADQAVGKIKQGAKKAVDKVTKAAKKLHG